MIDFHCHIDLYKDPRSVIKQIKLNRLSVVSMTTTPLSWSGTVALANGTPTIFTSVGLHPELVDSPYATLDRFSEILNDTPFVGEVGLDGSPHLRPTRSKQVEVLRKILELCEASGGEKLLSIHSRGAAPAVLECLGDFPRCGTPLMHWFSGSARELQRATVAGCWFSVGPAMLAGAKGRSLVALMPRNRVVAETDGPFAQIGDRSLEPRDVDTTAAMLADVWQCSVGDVRQQVETNEARLLSKVM